MSDTPTSDLAAMLQELHRSISGRLQAIETFLRAVGTEMQTFGTDLMRIDRRILATNTVGSQTMEDIQFLLGQIRANQSPHNKPIRDLGEVEFKVFSQWGEDGIIEWLVAHLPHIPRIFVEFGIEDFHEANCRFLLQNRGWKGLVMDGTEGNITALNQRPIIWQYDLSAAMAFVTAENIDSLLEKCGFTGSIGILSIDIDGNDYWVWDKISVVDPAIVICEMNGVLGDSYPVTIPYNPHFERLKAHYSGQYFGASIGALRHLGKKKGYTFLGTNSRGINAFFVRDDLAQALLPLIENCRAYPSLHRDSRDADGNLTFLSGRQRFETIKDMAVVDVVTGETIRLADLPEPYSPEWLADMAYGAV